MQSKHPFVLFHDPLVPTSIGDRSDRTSTGVHDGGSGVSVAPARGLLGRKHAVQQVTKDLAALHRSRLAKAPRRSSAKAQRGAR